MRTLSDRYKQEILKPYLSALIAIGVILKQDDVIEALELCNEGLEDACRAFIVWWKKQDKYLKNPTKAFIRSLYDGWKLFDDEWDDEILALPELIPRYEKWLTKARELLGNDFVNSNIMDVGIDMGGFEFIRLVNSDIFSLDSAYRMGFSAFKQKISQSISDMEQKYQQELERQQLIVAFKQRFDNIK